MDFDLRKKVFAPDGGALLDIRIFDTTAADWQAFLNYVSSQRSIWYSEDGHQKPLPKFDVISERSKLASPYLNITLDGVALSCSAFDASQIEIEFLPDDVHTPQKGQSIFEFMVSLARLLNKKVFLTPDNVSATQTQLVESALCYVDQSGSIHGHG
jgi:hypothetical protein